MNTRWLLHLATSLLGSSLLAMAATAWAQPRSGYTPPPPSGPPPSSERGGLTSRGGCEGGEVIPLLPLAPQAHVGRTASTHPSFAWFVPGAEALPIEFSIFEQGPGKRPKLVRRLELQGSPGMMSHAIPANLPGLSVGQRYLWQVALICDPNRPSTALVAAAEVDVVEATPSLATALLSATDSVARAQLYAQAGLWYDSLREILQPVKTPRAREFELTLLADLANLEATQGEQGSAYSAKLRQVVERERRHSPASPR